MRDGAPDSTRTQTEGVRAFSESAVLREAVAATFGQTGYHGQVLLLSRILCKLVHCAAADACTVMVPVPGATSVLTSSEASFQCQPQSRQVGSVSCTLVG